MASKAGMRGPGVACAGGAGGCWVDRVALLLLALCTTPGLTMNTHDRKQ